MSLMPEQSAAESVAQTTNRRESSLAAASGSLSARSRSRMSGSYVNAYVWPSGAVQSSRVNSGRYSFSRAQNLNVLLEVTRLPSDWTLADWISSIAAAYSSRPSSPKLCHPGSFDLSRSEEHTSELQSLMRISYAV